MPSPPLKFLGERHQGSGTYLPPTETFVAELDFLLDPVFFTGTQQPVLDITSSTLGYPVIGHGPGLVFPPHRLHVSFNPMQSDHVNSLSEVVLCFLAMEWIRLLGRHSLDFSGGSILLICSFVIKSNKQT